MSGGGASAALNDPLVVGMAITYRNHCQGCAGQAEINSSEHSLGCTTVGSWVPGASFNPCQSSRRWVGGPPSQVSELSHGFRQDGSCVLGPELAVRLPAEAAAHLTWPGVAWPPCLGLKGPYCHRSGEAGALGEGKSDVLQVHIRQASGSQQP